MGNRSRNYILGGLLLAAGISGVCIVATPAPVVRNVSAKAHTAALDVWNGAIFSHEQPTGQAALPAAGSVPESSVPAPRAAQAPATTPCPAHIEITNNGPNSSTNYHCSSTTTTGAGATSVSVSSNSYQSSNGASTSTSSTVINITSD